MNSIWKRSLAMLLSLVMVIGMLPVNAFADETEDVVVVAETEATETTEAPHSHSYASEVTTAATCEGEGVTTYTCECGDSYTEGISAAGHNYSEGACTVCGAADPNADVHTHSYESAVTAPSCEEGGYTTYTCSCGDSYDADETEATGHSYGEDGVCGACGEEKPVEETEHVHSYGEGAVTTEATCKEPGVLTFTCDCGETYTEEIAVTEEHVFDETIGSCIICGYVPLVVMNEVEEEDTSYDVSAMTDEKVAALLVELVNAGDEAAVQELIDQLDEERLNAVVELCWDELPADENNSPSAQVETIATVTVYKQVASAADITVDGKYYEKLAEDVSDLEAAVTVLKNANATGGLIKISDGTLVVTNRQDITMDNVIIMGAGEDKTTITGNASNFNNSTNGLGASSLSSEYKALIGLSKEKNKLMDLTVDGGDCGVSKLSGLIVADFKTVRINGDTDKPVTYLENVTISGKNGRSNLMVGTTSTKASVIALNVTVEDPSGLFYGATEVASGSDLKSVNSILGGAIVGATEGLGAGYYKATSGGITVYTTIPYAIDLYNSGIDPEVLMEQDLEQGVTIAKAMASDLAFGKFMYGKDADEMYTLAVDFRTALAGLSSDTNVSATEALATVDAAIAGNVWGATNVPETPPVEEDAPIVIPEGIVDTIVGGNTDDTVKNVVTTIVNEIKANTALSDENYDPVADHEDVEKLTVSLYNMTVESGAAAPTKITYTVEPKAANGNKVSKPSAAITFRLPIPASVTMSHAKVRHEGEYMGTYMIEGEDSGKYVEISSAEFSEYEVEPTNETGSYVAYIGATGYETLETALNAAKSGDTITIGADFTAETTYHVPAGVIIDGGNHTITVEGTVLIIECYLFNGDGFTVKNLTINNSATASNTGAFKMTTGTLENVTVNGGVYAVLALANEATPGLTIKGCTFANQSGNPAIYVDEEGGAKNLTIEGCTFNCERAVVLRSNETFTGNTVNGTKGITVYSTANGTISGNTFAADTDRSLNLYDTTATIENNTILSKVEADNVTEGKTIDLSENYWGGEAPADLPENVTVNSYYTTVSEDGTLGELVQAAPTYVAKIGDNTYATFDEAITAANSMTGDVIVEIYGKVEYSATTADLTGAYDSISFVGGTDDAEISITRDGSNGYISGSTAGNDCTVNFTNLILSKPTGNYAYDAGYMNVAFSVYRVGSVSYTNCTFPNGACARGDMNVTYTSCTFKKSHEKYPLWVYDYTNCTVDDCTFDDDRGIKMYAEDQQNVTASLTVKNSDFSKLTGKPAIVLTLGESVTLESGNKYSSTGVFELEDNGSSNGTTIVNNDTTQKITCVSDAYPNGCGVLVGDKIYRTVADAAAVATSGSTVTLLHNSTETVELPEGVTLNKNGYAAENVTVASSVPVEVATYDELVAALKEGKDVVLTADITLDTAITVPDGTVIDLNEKTLYVNVENSYYNDATIKNGNIVLGKDDVHVCDGYFLVNAGKTLVLDGVNMSSAEGGIKGYAVFHLKTGANLDLLNSTLNISDNEYAAGYIVYAGEDPTATVDVTNTTIIGSKVNGIVHATTTIKESTVTLTDVVEHGINRSATTIDGSNVTISGGTGRGITAQHGDLVITGNSVVNITDMGEATIELRNDKDLTVAETATVTVDAAVNNTTNGTITGTVTVKPTPQGNIQVGYISASYHNGVDAVRGEATNVVGTESFEVKLYSGETHVGTAALVDTGNVLLNGKSQTITWHAALTDDGDSWWSTTWKQTLNVNNIPNKVELWVDGVEVSEGEVQLNSDNLKNPIFAAVTDADGNVKSFVAGTGYLNGTGANAPAYDEALQTTFAAGGNIVLLRDITLTEKVTVNKDVTLDLNGKTITNNVVNDRLFHVYADFTIDGTDEGSAIVSGTAGTYGVLRIEADCAVTLNGGSYTGSTTGASGAKGGMIKAIAGNANGAKITLKNVTVETNNWIIDSPAYLDSLTITGGTYATNGVGITAVINQNGKATLTDVAVTSGSGPAVELSGYSTSTATLSGCTLNAGPDTVNAYGTGGTALYVVSGIKVTVESGSYTGATHAAGITTSGKSLTIKGGTFNGAIASHNSEGTVTIEGGNFTNFAVKTNGSTGKVAISGGSFDKAVAEEYCAEGFIPTQKEDDTYGVVEGSYVAEINGTKYTDLHDAMVAAKAGDIVTLLTDVSFVGSESLVVVETGKNITLDLNEKMITSDAAWYAINNKGTLTIKNGTIVATSDDEYYESYGIINNGGNLTLENVSVVADDNAGWLLSVYNRDGYWDENDEWVDSGRAANLTVNGSTLMGDLWNECENSGSSFAIITGFFEENVAHSDYAKEGIVVHNMSTCNYNTEKELYEVKEGTAIAEVDDVQYARISAAIAAADGKTVKLLAEVNDGSVVVNGDVTIDLNGQKANLVRGNTAEGYALKIAEGANLVVIDSSDAKVGTINLNWPETAGNTFVGRMISVNGSFTLNSGTITQADKSGVTSQCPVFDTYGTSASVTITGGTVNVGESSTTCLAKTGETGIAISGGSFNREIPEEFCAEGYIPVENDDGTYGVAVDTSVAQNTTTGVKYETVSEALAAATSGQTVKLMEDITEAESFITAVGEGITLDLNGHVLTATYLFAVNGSNVIDSSDENTGLVKAPMNSVILAVNNSQLPAWNEELGGYQFFVIKVKTNLQEDTTKDYALFRFYIEDTDDSDRLLALFIDEGAANHNLSVKVKLSFTATDGSAVDMRYAYNEAIIKDMANQLNSGTGIYNCTLNGINSREEITYSAVLESGTNVVLTYTAAAQQ